MCCLFNTVRKINAYLHNIGEQMVFTIFFILFFETFSLFFCVHGFDIKLSQLLPSKISNYIFVLNIQINSLLIIIVVIIKNNDYR
jgi:hypothetical protein